MKTSVNGLCLSISLLASWLGFVALLYAAPNNRVAAIRRQMAAHAPEAPKAAARVAPHPAAPVVPAKAHAPAPEDAIVEANANAALAMGPTLAELERRALELNPRLAQASFAVSAARGRAQQAGLYPNPTLGVTFDELFDRTGRSGVNTLPLVSQEFVTGGKLRLSQEAGQRQVEQEGWNLIGQRYKLLGEVRAKFYEAVALQARVEVLRSMIELAARSVAQANDLLKAKQVARLDVVQLEVELERLEAELGAALRELPAVYRDLAAAVGDPRWKIAAVDGVLHPNLPRYDLDALQNQVLEQHPLVQSARNGVERARLLVRRARVEPRPNVVVDAGYVRQNQNRSDDFRIGASIVVPLWNRNQGNIRAAEAEFCEAVQQARLAENQLAELLAAAMRDYAAASLRVERYAKRILPRAKETYDLSRQAYQGGEFEYLRILEAQRALAQANLEYVRALGDGWKAAAIISGLNLEPAWPVSAAEGAAPQITPAAH
jgi:cobalt-zinc-cadmium efflux system outer membrane protein